MEPGEVACGGLMGIALVVLGGLVLGFAVLSGLIIYVGRMYDSQRR